MTVPNRANHPARRIGDHTTPLSQQKPTLVSRIKKVWNNEKNPLLSGKKQGQLRGERIGRTYLGEGTYNPASTQPGPGQTVASRAQTNSNDLGYMAYKRRMDSGQSYPRGSSNN